MLPLIRHWSGCLLLIIGMGLMVGAGRAAEPEIGGKATSQTGLVLQQAGQEWQAVKEGSPVAIGATVVGLPGASLDSANEAVHLAFLADLDGRSQYPILESAVRPLAAGKADLAFVLDRGRVELTNRKAKGPASVVVQFRKETWQLSLEEPGTRVVLELYGRWPRGTYFKPGAKDAEGPAALLVLVVLQGSLDLKAGPHQFEMKAPPGPAIFTWDSIAGEEPSPKHLDKLPDWADPALKPTPEGLAGKARVEMAQQKLAKAAPGAVIAELLGGDDPLVRRGAMVLAGAVDDLPRLIDGLGDPKRADVRANAIRVLRHWIGRAPGQDEKLYQALQADQRYTAGQAELVLQGLHTPGAEQVTRPETYESLIGYLLHPKIAIRELARYHLYRLVPDAEKTIPFDAAGPEAERQAAQAAWKKLVPEGKLPPRPTPEDK